MSCFLEENSGDNRFEMDFQQYRKQQQACSLHVQNLRYSGTNGISENNRSAGLIPAFRDEQTGQVECSRLPNGDPAPIHLIASLPAGWVDDFDNAILKPNIVAGFVKDSVFYTRDEMASYCSRESE